VRQFIYSDPPRATAFLSLGIAEVPRPRFGASFSPPKLGYTAGECRPSRTRPNARNCSAPYRGSSHIRRGRRVRKRFRCVEPRVDGTAGPGGKKKAGWATFLLLLAAKAKTFLLGAKSLLILLKAGKILTTSGSMLISIWLYALAFGWPFGVGIVVSIFIHEMGHVFVAWRQGVPVSAPIFIPFMGALIIQKRSAKTAWAEALIGIGGPLGGTIGALLFYGVYVATGNHFFLGLAYFGFLINLFNLLPVFPLDGGWIVASISPYLWLAGLVALVALFAMGLVRNPFVIILVLMSLPTMWRGLTKKESTSPVWRRPLHLKSW